MRRNQENLRKQVKLCKVFHDVNYIYWSEQLEITKNSFYNWLHNQYDFSEARAAELEDLIKEIIS